MNLKTLCILSLVFTAVNAISMSDVTGGYDTTNFNVIKTIDDNEVKALTYGLVRCAIDVKNKNMLRDFEDMWKHIKDGNEIDEQDLKKLICVHWESLNDEQKCIATKLNLTQNNFDGDFFHLAISNFQAISKLLPDTTTLTTLLVFFGFNILSANGDCHIWTHSENPSMDFARCMVRMNAYSYAVTWGMGQLCDALQSSQYNVCCDRLPTVEEINLACLNGCCAFTPLGLAALNDHTRFNCHYFDPEMPFAKRTN